MLFIGGVISSCDNEDYSGDSTLSPSNPTVIYDMGEYTGNISFTEQDSTIEFTVSLSESQITDVILPISVVGGDATLDEDFEISNLGSSLTIPANSLSGTVAFKVLSDDVFEEDETFTIQVGDETTSNVDINPLQVTVEILNVTSGDLNLSLEWSTSDVYGADGSVYGATEVADLIFTIYDADGVSISESDGADFEALTIASTLPDGTYSVKASIFGVVELTSAYSLPIASLSMGYIQSGIQSGGFSFESALDLNFVCDLNNMHLVDIVKTGSSYEITKVGELPERETVTTGTYNVVTNGENTDGQPAAVDLAYEVTITAEDNVYTISDGVAGTYIFWYGEPYGYTFETPGTFIIDNCGEIAGSWVSAFSDTITITGTIEDDGTLNISWSNTFGDEAEAVYTLQ